MAMQDVYDFFFDVDSLLARKGLQRLHDMLRPAIMSGLLSDMLTASIAKHSRVLTQNQYFNGHPDLVVQGVYPGNGIKAGAEGIEIKTTRKSGGAVDTHGARDQWMCVFVYETDEQTEPAVDRKPMTFSEVYLRKSPRKTSGRIRVESLEPGQQRCTRQVSRNFVKTGSTGSNFHSAETSPAEESPRKPCHSSGSLFRSRCLRILRPQQLPT